MELVAAADWRKEQLPQVGVDAEMGSPGQMKLLPLHNLQGELGLPVGFGKA